MISAVPIAAAVFTAVLLSAVQVFVAQPRMLLLDRFIPGGGWAEVVLLAVYAAFIAGRLSVAKQVGIWRTRAWRLFSLVFFAQLAIGLSGAERFLMTGKLHLPIPALIVAGPVYRGAIGFMPILFLATILLVGPAWCSHLCYIGSWDDWAARSRKRPAILPGYRTVLRIGIMAVCVLVALAARKLGLNAIVAAALAVAFGLGGVAVMVFWSRKNGSMAHCTLYCPIGLVADLLGKVSPFRLRIGRECTDCGLCRRSCRYDALRPSDILKRRPGFSCTLCGDCLSSCKDNHIHYSFPGLGPRRARAVFIVTVVALHASFLGVARL